jgi:YHS domain-containing protein
VGGCGSQPAKEPAKVPAHSAPAPVVENREEAATAEQTVADGLKDLSAEDRAIAKKQRVCPVSGELLGAMGKPYKITVKGRTVFLCCSGCEAEFRKHPDKYFAKMKK